MRASALAPIAGLAVFTATAALAGEADVVGVRMTERGGTYDFAVTVRHADAGWTHYADKWEIVAPDGTVIATRVLAHPHDNEQPFNRSLGAVRIPADMPTVTVRAHDKVHGYGGVEMVVDMKTGETRPTGGNS